MRKNSVVGIIGLGTALGAVTAPSSIPIVRAPEKLSKDREVEAVAQAAFEELMADSRKNGTIVTPKLLHHVITKRVQEFLGPGTLMPNVKVGLREDRSGFDVEITPGDLPPGLFVKKPAR